MRRVEFEAADRAWHASRDRYRLSPREAYVLRSAPIRGLSHALSRRRHGESAPGRVLTIWLVRDENLSLVVEGLLRRGLLARHAGAGPACAELTAEGRAALEAGRTKPLR
jgi:hypothetical protein